MFVIVAVMVLIVAAAGILVAVVASTTTDEPEPRLGFAGRIARRLGIKRQEQLSSITSLTAMHQRSTGQQD